LDQLTPDEIFEEKLIDLRSNMLVSTKQNKVPRKKYEDLKNGCVTFLNESKL